MKVATAPIDFLVIGAQKCATSWMYYCLRDHPQLKLPRKKLEVEYLGGALYEERGADWYFGLVGARENGEKLGDVSVEYIFDPRSAAVVRELLPDVKLISILRQPIERTISAYYWYVRKARLPDLSLADGLREGLRAWRANDRSTEAGELIERSLYAPQLERYLNEFGRDPLLVLTYDEVDRDPASVVRTVYDFIGVDPSHQPETLADRPKQNAYVEPLIRLERMFPHSQIVSKLADLASIWVNRRGLAKKRPELPDDLYAELAEVFAADIARTKALIGAPSRTMPESRIKILDRWLNELTV